MKLLSILVLSIGASNLDYILKVPSFVKEDSEMFIEEINTSPGGSALNFAVNLSRLGIRTGLLTRLGNDASGKLIADKLNQEGVDTSHCTKINEKTGMAFISVDDYGKRSIYSFPGANAKLDLKKEEIDYIKSAKLIHLAGVYWEIAGEVAKYASNLSFSPGSLLSSYGVDKLKKVIKRTEFLFLNQREVNILTNYNLDEGAQLLLDEGASKVIITLGNAGAKFYTKDNTFTAPTKKIKALDSTGAGDAFAAGFIFKYLQGEDSKESLEFANQIASSCVKFFGAIA